jgi:2-polyprenyl-3-methyl-5-hydroxy-6-metoxy-1,4-benzoquinol methylase
MNPRRSAARAEVLLTWVKGPDVLDVGCTGHVVRLDHPEWLHGRLRERFPSVWGIDIDPANVGSLRDLGYDNVQLADAQQFSLGQTFDTVVAGELLEHLEKPGSFLQSAADHLKEGGRIVLSTPYPFGLHQFFYALYRYPKTCSNPEHTLWVCPSTLSEMARRAGLDVTHWELVSLIEPTESRKYRWFVRTIQLFSWILPRRLRNNTLLAVLEPRSYATVE